MKIEFNNITEYMDFVSALQREVLPAKSELEDGEGIRFKHINERFENMEATITGLMDNILALQKQVKELKQKQEVKKPVKNNIKPTVTEKPKYAKSYTVKLNIKDIKPDGTIIMAGNKKSKYTMFDLLKIRKMLQDNKPLKQIADCFENIGEITVYRICWNIEEGYLNGWFYEWNKIPKKKVEVVNNPEKRKELLGFA